MKLTWKNVIVGSFCAASLAACNSQKSAPVSEPAIIEPATVVEEPSDEKEVVVSDSSEAVFGVVLAPVVGGKDSEIELSVTNRGDSSARFCDYHTPFEGFRNSFLRVLDSEGVKVRYNGMMAKRAAPTKEDYITLASDETKTIRFDVRDGYTLVAGEYQVQFEASQVSGLPASNPITITIPK